ncbi:MAG: hypothetical protein KME48_12770 [Candidatus Thiodiazotropha sp. (ex Ctena orbiculata)]|nr:hypothetical protein [Candidatus Thiodiazotropha taylori]MBT3035628.1 hypothetical protein [Candidatus Thiodiazotropha taylori]
MAGTCRHQDAASTQNQTLTLISVWLYLALAGIGKQLLPIVHGIDHGIVVTDISALIQYHAMLVELFMVLGAENQYVSIFWGLTV